LKLTFDRHEASRGLFATAELLVKFDRCAKPYVCRYHPRLAAPKRRNISKTVQVLTTSIQQAQLSQIDRATLLVIEYFAKSLEAIRNDTVK